MENLLWVDIETTGLHPADDAILEIALVITDQNLKTIDTFSRVTKPSRPKLITDISPAVASMHTATGLWAETLLSDFTVDDAVHEMANCILAADAKGSIVAGSGINFDRSFIRQQIPHLDELMHYRSIDVRTLTNMMRLYRPDIYENCPKGERTHRALSDIHDSINEYRYYKEALAL